MQFSLRDSISLASGSHNEDRFGQHGAAVWVIDGATDLLEKPLLPGPSDAAWIADALNLAFTRLATQPDMTLTAILRAATAEVRGSFDKAASRPIVHRHEQPSAAGIFARISGGMLEALSLGDCTLLSLPMDGPPLDLFRAKREADEEARAAARALNDAGNNQHEAASIRAELMPLLRRGRDRLNTPDGYGAFSIDLPPERHVREVRRPVSIGDVFLLASDGFLRLVDVYSAYTLPAFGAAIRTDGIASLAVKLRELETEDADRRRFPRVKVMDDATALIVEVTA